MPTSNLACWPSILNLCWQVHPHSVLDVGPGWGKAGILLREYVAANRVDAVEAWGPYVTPRLRAVYDEVIVGDVRDLPDEKLASYDLVLMADVIEHMDRQDALTLLWRIPGYVVLCTPREFFQNPEAAEIPPEEHRSLWTPQDFHFRAEVIDYEAHRTLGAVIARLSPLTRR